MPDNHPIRDDLYATLEARRDLGPEYESALVEGFVERLDATIAARVHAEMGHPGFPPRKKAPGAAMIPITLGSLGIGVPLTGIAAHSAGLIGLLITWLGIVLVNVAAASAIMRRP